MRSVQGRVAVVTGAASGIGEALATMLAGMGAVVEMSDVNEERLQGVASRLRDGGGQVRARVVDVSDAAAVTEHAREVSESHGRVALLFNNAGLTVYGTFEEHSPADFERVMRVNVGGVVNGCRSFLPLLRADGDAMIVNISSVFGLIGVPGQSAYCASKHAVRGFSESLRHELRGTGVGVLCVHPGGVATNIVREGRAAEGLPAERNPLPRLAEMFDRFAMKPERAARLIVRAALRRKSRLLVAREAPVIDWLSRSSPVIGSTLANRLIGSFSRT